MPALSIQSSEKALNLEGLPEGKTTQLQNGAMRFDRDAWQCRDSDAVGYSKDHSTAVESEYQGRPCKIIVTMDGEGHCGKDAAVRNKTEETFQGAAASAAETLKSASYDSSMHALTTFRDNFERGTTARISSQDNPVPNYAGKPMMAMILGDKAYFACDSANTADGGFVILNKEGTAARFVSPEDVPCEVDLTKGDRVIAFTDGCWMVLEMLFLNNCRIKQLLPYLRI